MKYSLNVCCMNLSCSRLVQVIPIILNPIDDRENKSPICKTNSYEIVQNSLKIFYLDIWNWAFPLYFLLYIVNVWVCRLLLPPLIGVRDKEEQRDKCHVWQLVSFGLNSLYDTNYSLSPHKSYYYWAWRIWEADIFLLYLGKDLILWGISFRLWKKKNTALFSKRTSIT